MIVLDTNVVSEGLRVDGHAGVKDWLGQQSHETLFLAAPTLAELLFGIEVLPDGQRKSGIAERLRQFLHRRFDGRILGFDQRAAEVYAPMVGRARRAGSAIAMADGQIAAIAAARGFAVATRDVKPFIAGGVTVINPWTSGTAAP